MIDRVKRFLLYAVMAVMVGMCLSACDTVTGLLGDGVGEEEEGDDDESYSFDPNIRSFYVRNTGSDSGNGLSESAPFKTLAKAYTAALGSSDRKRVVVLSNLIEEGLVTLPPDGTVVSGTDPVLIEGKTAGLKIERSVGADDSVLEIKGGAQIVFKNIKINGKISDNDGTNRNNRALRISGLPSGTTTKVTLGDRVVITGKLATSSGNVTADDKDGSGILIVLAVLEMTGSSQVTGCVTNTTMNYAKGAVVAYYASEIIMNGGSISDNTVSGTQNVLGGGVHLNGNGSILTMGEGAVISDNDISSAGGTAFGGGVYVSTNGQITMKDDAVISGNRVTAAASFSAQGGGVYVGNSSFSMSNSSAVKNNFAIGTSSAKGGGVYVNGYSFSMGDDASISGNIVASNSTSCGGGVYQADGTTTINGGVIFGNSAGTSNNIASNGAAYYKEGGTANPANLETTNNTIAVIPWTMQ
jgi:hypothetical protein